MGKDDTFANILNNQSNSNIIPQHIQQNIQTASQPVPSQFSQPSQHPQAIIENQEAEQASQQPSQQPSQKKKAAKKTQEQYDHQNHSN